MGIIDRKKLKLLIRLIKNNKVRTGELYKGVYKTRRSCYSSLEDLEKEGLITISKDGRSLNYSVTKKGVKVSELTIELLELLK